MAGRLLETIKTFLHEAVLDSAFHKLNFVAVLLFSLGLAPYLDMFEEYVFSDWQFMMSVLVLVGIDTVTGVWKGFEQKQISSYRFRDVLRKLVLYFMLMIAGSVGATYMVQGEQNVILGIFDNIIYGFIMVTECISILENMAELGVPVPIWIKKRLRNFTDRGVLDPFEGEERTNGQKPKK